MIPFHDIGANAVCGVSNRPGTTADNNGSWVDMGESIGNVNAILMFGAATGTPDTSAATFKIQEADNASGDGVQDIAGATGSIAAAAPAANDGKVAHITTGQRSKRYCRVVSDITLAGGSTPTQPHSSLLLARKANT